MRKNRLFCLLLILTVAIAGSTPAFARKNRGLSIKLPNQRGKLESLKHYDKSYALLIGVSDYTSGWPDLESIPQELKSVEKALRDKGFTIINITNPDGDELKQAFEKFINDYGL